MLQNVTCLAIVAIHTVANEPPKVRQVMNKIHRNVAAGCSQSCSSCRAGGAAGCAKAAAARTGGTPPTAAAESPEKRLRSLAAAGAVHTPAAPPAACEASWRFHQPPAAASAQAVPTTAAPQVA